MSHPVSWPRNPFRCAKVHDNVVPSCPCDGWHNSESASVVAVPYTWMNIAAAAVVVVALDVHSPVVH